MKYESLSTNAMNRIQRETFKDRDVLVKPKGRGFAITQVYFIDPNSEQYQEEVQSLLNSGWELIEF